MGAVRAVQAGAGVVTLPMLVGGAALIAVQDSFNGLSIVGLALIWVALFRVVAGFTAFNERHPIPADDPVVFEAEARAEIEALTRDTD